MLKWIHNTYLNNIVMQRTAPAKCNISNNYQLSQRWSRSRCRWQAKTLHFCSSKSQSRCIFSWIAHLDAFFSMASLFFHRINQFFRMSLVNIYLISRFFCFANWWLSLTFALVQRCNSFILDNFDFACEHSHYEHHLISFFFFQKNLPIFSYE